MMVMNELEKICKNNFWQQEVECNEEKRLQILRVINIMKRRGGHGCVNNLTEESSQEIAISIKCNNADLTAVFIYSERK